MEVIGFILGVAGVIAPAYQAVEALTDRVSAIKNFPKTLRTFNAQFSLQKKLFDNECILLFSSEFDEALIREMLRNEKHPMWEDREFQQKFRDHLGDFFGQSVLLPFGIITETVRQLEKEIDLVTIGDKGKPVRCASLSDGNGNTPADGRIGDFEARKRTLSKITAAFRDAEYGCVIGGVESTDIGSVESP
jgi:hypothetical protein